jgi:hypothetical protein
MMKRDGFVSPAEAAEQLRICRRTALAWAHKSLDVDDDDDAPFKGVERTATGRLLIPREEVERMLPTRRR